MRLAVIMGIWMARVAFGIAVGVLVSVVLDGGGFFGAFDLVIEPVGLGGYILPQGSGTPQLPKLLQVGLLLGLRAAEDRAGKRVEIGHKRLFQNLMAPITAGEGHRYSSAHFQWHLFV